MITTLKNLLNLNKGAEDKQKTLDNVISNISFSGANLWILACAIMVASVGLNINSTAVVIGAMLISPLMGPIVGAGFALGIYDFNLLKKSLVDLLIATVVSLIVATLYFYLSPFKEIQSELLARTSPTIFDALIAFFGGLAGVIAITRVEKGNPIPGVAISTALMPALCTAGYGIATANWNFFFGAMFLYCINCVFICIATYSIVKYLKYPASEKIDIKNQKLVKYGVTFIIILMLLPSAFFAFTMYKAQQFKQLSNNFIEKEFIEKGYTLVYKKINYSTTSRTIELAFLKKGFTETEIQQLNEKLKNDGLLKTKLSINENSTDNLQNFKNDILKELNKKDNALSERDKNIALLENKLTESTFDNNQLLSEINIFLPTISSFSVSKQNIASKDSIIVTTVLIYKSSPELIEADKEKLKNWLLKKLNINDINIIESEY